GALTRLLAQRARRVVAVELDGRFLPILHNELRGLANVQIVQGDILAQEPGVLFDQPYKVVANVPYYITGAILRHLLAAAHKPELMVLTVQREVAERLTAVPPHMSLLAVSVQFYGRVQTITTIKAGAFWPRPDVDSAAAGFSQKRKQLQNNLRQLGLDKGDVIKWLDAAEVDGRRRAETLSLPEWLALYHSFPHHPGKFKPNGKDGGA
ncbi:MAG: 16S rRNA (adenine(1518)-N(6)/adenine(1519)-N(6))-dimethyltransferase, partial [Anaerolineae bacterium]|nr:16S rRNA (adenine(1518)-N(6)/adenine(1519)-N(6))-dimethyltransferase [Anaerolineae bacterium]